MNVITISREYGAAGGEVGRRIAERLGWAFLDREILHRTADLAEAPEPELEKMDEHPIGLRDRFRLHPLHGRYLRALTQVVTSVAAKGDAVLVGRGTNFILRDAPDALHLRFVAPADARARRMAGLEGIGLEEAQRRCAGVDRQRGLFTRSFFKEDGASPSHYDLTVNTGRIPLDDVVEIAVAAARQDFPAMDRRPGKRRLLTVSRQVGAGEWHFADALGKRLGLPVVDREFLHREAEIAGAPEFGGAHIDEIGPTPFERLQKDRELARYFEALSEAMKEYADRGDVILVGRGGALFLKDHSDAFHAFLTADMAFRVQRVMTFRWVNEGRAREIIGASDRARTAFYRTYFGVDWVDPLHYDLTVNTGRLGTRAVDLVAYSAERRWRG